MLVQKKMIYYRMIKIHFNTQCPSMGTSRYHIIILSEPRIISKSINIFEQTKFEN